MHITKERAEAEIQRLQKLKRQREADLNGAIGALEQAYVTLSLVLAPEPTPPEAPKPTEEAKTP